MYKLIILIMLFVSANATIPNSNLGNTDQKSLKSISDFKELSNLLKKFVSFGDYSKAMALGALYGKDHIFKKGSVKKDEELSKYYFDLSFSNGYGISSLMLLKYSTVDEKLLLLEEGLKGAKNSREDNEIIALYYNTIILDRKHNNARYARKALNTTLKIAESSNSPALDFTIANLFNLIEDKETANKWLNTACNNPLTPILLKESCNKSVGISNRTKDKYLNNIKKTKKCETCGVLK